MIRGGRPGAVRRFLARPWVWVGVALIAAPTIIWADAHSRNDAAPGPDALRIDATVQSIKGVTADVAYDNPLTGQRVETTLDVATAATKPGKGDHLTVTVDRADPENLRLPGDKPAPTFDLVALGLLLGVPILWVAVRWWSIHASERLAGRTDAPTFAMVGALAAPRWVGRRACLHIWPLDSPPGSEALCAVPVLVSGGLPVGTAFPVEVKGSPRSLGRVVARTGDTVLWPAARSLRAAWLRRPAHTDPTPPTLAQPPRAAGPPEVPGPRERAGAPDSVGPSEQRTGPPRPTGRRSERFLAAHAPFTLALAASLVACAVVTTLTLLHRRDAERLYRDGTEVIAEITERGGSTVTVRYTLPGKTDLRTDQVPVDWPGEQELNLKLPAVVDPDEPGRLRFLRERYDAQEPIGWTVIPVAATAVILLTQFRTWRRSARIAARGPWRPVLARRRVTGEYISYLEIISTPTFAPVLEVRLPTSAARRVAPQGSQPTALEMAGDPDPGSPIALRNNGEVLAVSGPARVPRRDRPRQIPPWRRAGWPTPRPGPDPTAS